MFWLTYILCNCINSTEERIEGKWIFRTRWSTAASNLFHMFSPAESLCAVSMTQAAVLTDTLHVENIHQSKLLHTCDICPPSSVQKTPTNTQMTDQMVQMAKAQKITYPPPQLSASLLHPRSHPTPLLTCSELTARAFHWSPHLRLATSTLIILSVQKTASDAFMPTTTPAVFSH